ncbi:cysteine desulfurase-like protein [Aestuariivirga litoralis]|uniref:Cysteine desulfurase-like protein n=1 Tax=Aestuariivirga litoralis TaxID=2650924 RepID=A0A2W2BBK3_9HYPH|nr:cysteine desulfurase-like protein [Aestuariivirga litoralis]PZF77634.1 cysteine desulfurase-like protein [Aestuariivirga litoralis]
MSAALDIAAIRAQFPALGLKDQGRDRIYFDNPAGTQVPQRVIDRTVDCLANRNANLGGYFTTTVEAGELVDLAHQACADFYNARSMNEIVFGQNMTSLTLHMSRCLGKQLKRGDEIVLSRMDHDANVAPWLLLADDLGLVVRWIDFDTETYEFPKDALTRVLSDKTKLLAMGMASNCTGTVNDTRRFAAEARKAGAIVYLDAVQFAPHYAIDVQDLGADFVVSSAYKWFGPHQGILWGREDLLKQTFGYKVRPAGEDLPHKFETGTLSHEGMAGTLGAIEYLEQFGTGETRAKRIASAWNTLADYEHKITRKLIEGLKTFKGLTIRGITSANAMHRRVPTVSFTLDGHHPEAMAKAFAKDNIFVWSGHNYAIEPVGRMGLMDKGGVLRVGLAHYNTEAEVDALLSSLTRQIRSA